MTADRTGEPLAPLAATLRAGDRDPEAYVRLLRDRIDDRDGAVRAWVDGGKERAWLESEARALAARHPEPAAGRRRPVDGDDSSDSDGLSDGRRPPLFGVPVGVKDVIHVDGLPTRAGSDVPPGALAGPEATVVRRLRAAGALVAGKTHTAEFAHFVPGPTRNPHDRDHTPGGSSSGSAAAVASGTAPLALGTQTIGSIVRPAAFCGVVGFKPTFGRLPADGTVAVAPSVDTVGWFVRDVAGAALVASVCLDGWTGEPGAPGGRGTNATGGAATANRTEAASGAGTAGGRAAVADRPTLGVPDGAYLAQAEASGREAFEQALDALAGAGYDLVRVEALPDVDAVNDRHRALVAGEAAMAHADRYDAHGDRYADATAELIERGRGEPVSALVRGRRGRRALRESLADLAADRGIDAWVSPAAPGPAPEGLDTTGDPVMNLPWTHAGLPTVSLPAGDVGGLPVGVQVAAGFGDDERLLRWARDLSSAVDGAA